MRLIPFHKSISWPNAWNQKPKSLAEFHNVYYPIIFRYIAFRIGDAAAAEQLTDQLLLLLLEEPNICNREADLPTQLLWSLTARAVKGYQKSSAHPKGTAVSEASVLASISALPEEHQILLALFYGCHLTIEQVAQALGRSLEATRHLQAQTLIALHRQLQTRA